MLQWSKDMLRPKTVLCELQGAVGTKAIFSYCIVKSGAFWDLLSLWYKMESPKQDAPVRNEKLIQCLQGDT